MRGAYAPIADPILVTGTCSQNGNMLRFGHDEGPDPPCESLDEKNLNSSAQRMQIAESGLARGWRT